MTPYYSDDSVTIYHGDSLEILPTLRERVDAVITDPPFFMPAQHYSSRVKWQRSWGDTSILAGWWDSVVDALVRGMKETGHFVTFCDGSSYPVFYPALYRRFDAIIDLVWDKGKIGMGSTWRRCHELVLAARWDTSIWSGGHSRLDVLKAASVPQTERLHPVDKPESILRQLIEPVTVPGDLVLDPFMGGGSTLLAAKGAQRRAIGIEMEERYCEIAARRMGQGVLDFGGAA